MLHLNSYVLLGIIQLLLSHLVKYAGMRAFYDPYFPVYGQNRIVNTGKYGYDSVHILEITDQRKPLFRHISCSILRNIFSHTLDLRENISVFSWRKLFLRDYLNWLTLKISGARNLMGLRYVNFSALVILSLSCTAASNVSLNDFQSKGSPLKLFKVIFGNFSPFLLKSLRIWFGFVISGCYSRNLCHFHFAFFRLM